MNMTFDFRFFLLSLFLPQARAAEQNSFIDLYSPPTDILQTYILSEIAYIQSIFQFHMSVSRVFFVPFMFLFFLCASI